MGEIARVVLIGFSGTGKSTAARLVAARLGWSWVDTDDEIERRWGQSIPVIFRDQGEPAFRASEREALNQALRRDEVVIATGGGAVVADDAWGADALGSRGTLVIALDANPETVLDRLRQQAEIEPTAATAWPCVGCPGPTAAPPSTRATATGCSAGAPGTRPGSTWPTRRTTPRRWPG